MINFLPAGIIKDTITDIHQKTVELKNERDILRLKKRYYRNRGYGSGFGHFLRKTVM